MSQKTEKTAYVLTDEQKEFYRSNGYLVIDDLITSDECDFLLKRILLHANKEYAAILNPDRESFLAAQDPLSPPEVIRETARIFREYMKYPKTVSVVEALQGREVVGLMSQMLFKWAGTPYAAQAWNPHQDNNYPRNPNKQYITTNLFLLAADKENGSLYIYPGSHQEDLLEADPTISYREPHGYNPGNSVRVPEKYKKVDLTFKKGSLLVLHGHAIHGSYANVSKTRSRPFYSCSYISKGESFVPGNNAQRMEIPLR